MLLRMKLFASSQPFHGLDNIGIRGAWSNCIAISRYRFNIGREVDLILCVFVAGMLGSTDRRGQIHGSKDVAKVIVVVITRDRGGSRGHSGGARARCTVKKNPTTRQEQGSCQTMNGVLKERAASRQQVTGSRISFHIFHLNATKEDKQPAQW